jgi:hypothetical protein
VCWCWRRCGCGAGGTTTAAGTVFEKIIHHFTCAPVLRGFVTNGSLWQTHLQHLAVFFKIFFVARRVGSLSWSCCGWLLSDRLRCRRGCWFCWCWRRCGCGAGSTTTAAGAVLEKIIHHFTCAPVLRGFVTNGPLWQTHLQHLAVFFKIFFVARRVGSSLSWSCCGWLLSDRLRCGCGRRRRGDRIAGAVIEKIIHDFVTDPFLRCLTSNGTFWKPCFKHLPIPVEIFLIPSRVWHLSWLGFWERCTN